MTITENFRVEAPLTDGQLLDPSRAHVVFGSPDGERNEAVNVALAAGARISLATHGGKEVHPGNAYNADPVQVEPGEEVIFFECNIPGLTPSRRADHHFPGDAGYDVPAAGDGYLRGSPLGQLATLFGVELTPRQKAVAANDHHLRIAVLGLCNGVSTEQSLAAKYEDIAMKNGWDVSVIEKTVDGYHETVETAPRITIGDSEVLDLRHLYLGYTNSIEYLSLQVAIIQAGEAGILCTQDEEDAPIKLSLCGGTPELTRIFKEEWAPDNGLDGVYGCPVREYAGGYDRSSYEIATAARHLLGLATKTE